MTLPCWALEAKFSVRSGWLSSADEELMIQRLLGAWISSYLSLPQMAAASKVEGTQFESGGTIAPIDPLNSGKET